MKERMVNALCWVGIFLAGFLLVVMLTLPIIFSEAHGQELFTQESPQGRFVACPTTEAVYTWAFRDMRNERGKLDLVERGECAAFYMSDAILLRVIDTYTDGNGKVNYICEFLLKGTNGKMYSIAPELPPWIKGI